MEKVVYLSFAQGYTDGKGKWFSNVNGPLLAKSVSAVMIRAGQGIWEDPLFRLHYQLCIDNKIPFGFWWFNQPNMIAQYQIDSFMKLWNSVPITPKVVAYDVEEIDYFDQSTGTWKKLFPPSKKFSHDNVMKWCKDIKQATGANVGLYSRKLYIQDWLYETSEWYDFWLWIAAWYKYTGAVAPALPWKWPGYKLHQYEGGDLGTPGVDPVKTCKEYFNGDHQNLLDFFGVNDLPNNESEELKAEIVKLNTEIVKLNTEILKLNTELFNWNNWYLQAPK